MGLPRFSLKGYFFYVLCLSGLLLVILNLLQDEIWHRMRPHPGQTPPARVAEHTKVVKAVFLELYSVLYRYVLLSGLMGEIGECLGELRKIWRNLGKFCKSIGKLREILEELGEA